MFLQAEMIRKLSETFERYINAASPGPSGIKIFNPGIFRDGILPNPGIRDFSGRDSDKKSRDFSFKNPGILADLKSRNLARA